MMMIKIILKVFMNLKENKMKYDENLEQIEQ